MAGNGNGSKSLITFDSWKTQLRKDCELQDKLIAFDALGESVLRLLWAQGLDPSVKSIIDGTSRVTPRADENQMERA